jgi:hypothetical protein
MWYLHTMEFYAAMKKNKMLWFAGKWMELENIILSEISLAQGPKIVYVLPHMRTLDQGQKNKGIELWSQDISKCTQGRYEDR